MDDLFGQVLGLPLHPLVIHFAVVLIPMAAAGVIGVILFSGLRKNYSLPVLLFLIASLPLAFVAKESGEELADALYEPERHAELGELVPPSVLAMLVLFGIWFFLSRTGKFRSLFVLAGAINVLAAVGLIVLVVFVGHSGAEATWGFIPSD